MPYRCTFPIEIGGVYVPGFGRFQAVDGVFDLPSGAIPILEAHGLHFEAVTEPTPEVVVEKVAEPVAEEPAEAVTPLPTEEPASETVAHQPKRRGRPPKIRTEP